MPEPPQIRPWNLQQAQDALTKSVSQQSVFKFLDPKHLLALRQVASLEGYPTLDGVEDTCTLYDLLGEAATLERIWADTPTETVETKTKGPEI